MSHSPSVGRPSVGPATAVRPACTAFPALFQDALLEEPPAGGRPVAERRRYDALAAEAGQVCARCPLVTSCLYAAVVDHDVAGFVAGTTAKERAAVRRRLGVVVEVEDFDTLAGVTARHRQVDHDEVLRLRRAHPDESLETIARRLGCSLSTIKRHLRKARSDGSPSTGPLTPVRTSRPSLTQVLTALVAVRGAKDRPATSRPAPRQIQHAA
jgi:hypothetical protein